MKRTLLGDFRKKGSDEKHFLFKQKHYETNSIVASSKTHFEGMTDLVPEGTQLCIFKTGVASATRQRSKIAFRYFFILDQTI